MLLDDIAEDISWVTIPGGELMEQIGSLFNNETESDLLILCNGGLLHAHKAILSVRSSQFVGSILQSAHQSEVKLAVSYEAMHSFLELLYTACTIVSEDLEGDFRKLIEDYGVKAQRDVIDSERKLKYSMKPISSDLEDLLENSEFADISFSVDGKEVKSHRCILSIRSQYFRGKLNFVKASGSEEQSIHIQEASYDAFLKVLNYLLTDSIAISHDTVLEVLHYANLTMMNRLSRICERYLIENMTSEHAVDLLNISKNLQLPALHCHCLLHIQSNFKECMAKSSSPELLAAVQQDIQLYCAI